MHHSLPLIPFLLALAAPPTATPKAGAQWLPVSTRVSRPTFDAVALDLSPLNNSPDVKNAGLWPPSVDDVLLAERGLEAFLRTSLAWRSPRIRANLSLYKRQYTGFTRAGRRLLAVQFFHPDSPPVHDGTWATTYLTVAGGGDLFFRLTFDPSSRTYGNVWVNAPE